MRVGLSGKIPTLCWASGPVASSVFDGLLGPHNDEYYWTDLDFLPGKEQKLAWYQSSPCLLDQAPPTMQDNHTEPFKGTCDDLIKSDRIFEKKKNKLLTGDLNLISHLFFFLLLKVNSRINSFLKPQNYIQIEHPKRTPLSLLLNELTPFTLPKEEKIYAGSNLSLSG